MQPWQQRLLTEQDELQARIEKLKAFLDPIQIHGVSPAEHERLKRQLAVMQEYNVILQERISHADLH